MAAPKEAILAIDLGTSSVKTVIMGRDLQVVGRGMATYTTLHPRDDRDEQHVEDWLTAIATAAGNARRFAINTTIVAISITGQMHGTVLFDQDEEPIGDAIIWSDRRAASLLPEVLDHLGPGLPTIIGGPLGTGYQALTLMWLRANRPTVWSQIARVGLPADAIGFLLTNRLATDPGNAASTGFLDVRTSTWDDDLLGYAGVPLAWLPDLVPTGEQIGALTAQAAALLDLPVGLPVYHAGGDAQAAAIGGGVVHESDAMVTLSTGAQAIRPTAVCNPEPAGRWHTWPAGLPAGVDAPRWLSVGAVLNAGRAINWIHRTLAPGLPMADVIALAGSASAGSDGVLFLPYLAGERSPLLDPHASGSFIGLRESHEPRHLIRAVIEGIAFAIADALDRMTGDGPEPDSMILGGGGSSPEIRQIMASVLGYPLAIPPVTDSSAVGAARIAAHVLGWHDITAPPPRNAVTIVNPVRADRELYRERLEIYRETARCLRDVSHLLQGVG